MTYEVLYATPDDSYGVHVHSLRKAIELMKALKETVHKESEQITW